MLLRAHYTLLLFLGIVAARSISIRDDTIDTVTAVQADGTLYVYDESAASCVADSTPDCGSDLFYEAQVTNSHLICPRAGQCPDGDQPAQRPAWLNVDGSQKGWRVLTDDMKSQIWEAAGKTGMALKLLMDEYTSRGVSRAGPEQDIRFRENYYERVAARTEHYQPIRREMMNSFSLVPTGLEESLAADFTSVSWYAKKNEGPVLNMAASFESKMLVTDWAYSRCDKNPASERAFSSSITFNVWKNIAPQDYRGLKYHMMSYILNHATNNIMSLAHLKYPRNLFQVPENGSNTPLSPIAANGIFRVGDPGYVELLAAPNVKTMVQMLIDYNPDMNNPYINAVYTFPTVDKWTVPEAASKSWRQATLVVEFGARPASLGPAAAPGTIDTA